jgi:hypothetical protein
MKMVEEGQRDLKRQTDDHHAVTPDVAGRRG